MQTIKSRGVMARRLMAFTLLTFFAFVPTFGQTTYVVKIPYEFAIGSKVMPAGNYTFSMRAEDPSLVVRPDKGEAVRAFIVTRLGGPIELRDGSLVFDKTGDRRILSEVWIPGMDGILLHSTPKNHSHDMLLLSDLNQKSGLSGGAVYERTCRRCHGPDGMGNETADKFFNTAIPRLSSASVQGKSDEELRDIITKGRRAMDPVQLDESGFRHRLATESIDAVIAYVRTLKR